MPFEEVTSKVEALAAKKPVMIRLNPTSGKPSCVISVRKAIAEAVKFESGDSAGISFGTGEDAGKLRLTIKGPQQGIAPLHVLKKGSFSIHVGYIERFGLDAKQAVGVDAIAVDDKTIEITLPKWDEVPAFDAGEPEDDDDETKPEPEAPAPEEVRSSIGRAAEPATGDHVDKPGTISRQGVVITMAPPGIKHDGNELPLSITQQRIMAILLPSLDMGYIPASIVAKKMNCSEEAVRMAMVPLQSMLGKVDLSVELIKGAGYVIKKI